MTQSNQRSVEQNNVGFGPQVVNNHFHGITYLSSLTGMTGIVFAAGILMLVASPFMLIYPLFSVSLAVSGLLLLTGAGGWIARLLGIRVTGVLRGGGLLLLIVLNLPFAIGFAGERSRLAEVRQTRQLQEQQARYDERQRKDSLDLCLQRIDSLFQSGDMDKALMELDRADLLAETIAEQADVNQIRIEVSLAKGKQLMKRRQYNMAIDLFSSVHELDTTDSDVLYQRALCYVKTDHIANAVRDAKRAMDLGHGDAGRLYEKINPMRKQVAFYCTLCRDGTYSNAKGSGACSYHGGVARRNYPVYEHARKYE